MLTKEKLKQVLESLNLEDPQIEVFDEEKGRFMAEIISPSFATMEDFDRQALVLGKVLDDLSDRDSRQVEFIFTYAPGELEAAIAEAIAEATEAEARVQP